MRRGKKYEDHAARIDNLSLTNHFGNLQEHRQKV